MKFCCMSKERTRLIVMYGLYMLMYSAAFVLLERRNTDYLMMMCSLDALIPFCELFIVPYYFWFVYLALTFVYFMFFCEELDELRRLINSFMMGMSVFLVISLLFPNGHVLRPVLDSDGILSDLVHVLHQVDTPTNVFPSMHVFCTVSASAALLRQEKLTQNKGFRLFVLILSVLIILSTCFLKQHSVLDVFGALVLNLICIQMFYRTDIQYFHKRIVFQMNKKRNTI